MRHNIITLKSKSTYILLYFCLIIVILLSLKPVRAAAAESDFEIKKGVLKSYTGEKVIVVIPDTVTSIGDEAFRNNSNIQTVYLPDSVKSVGDRAFLGCSHLKYIIIPTHLSGIGWKAFYGTPWLADKQRKNSIVVINHILIDGTTCRKKVTIPSGVKVIGKYAFYNNNEITSLQLPSTVKTIEKSAFSLCSNLKSINIPKSVTTIGKSAFSSCAGLKTISLPNTLTAIDAFAFSDCSNLRSIIIPNSVITIDKNAFSGCSSLTSVSLPSNLTKIEDRAFVGCSELKEVKLPKYLTVIGSSAFSDNYSLTNIIIPKSVKYFGAGAFEDTPWLKKMRRKSPLVIINHTLIDAAHSSGKVKVPESVYEISAYAFAYSSVSEVILQNGINKINDYAFSYCYNLSKIYIPRTLTYIGNNVFTGSNFITNLKISQGNTKFSSKGNFLLSKDKLVLIGCVNSKGVITIPEGVETVGSNAFFSSRATKIVFPSTLKRLKDQVFANCSNLTEIDLPSSFLTFGKQKFIACPDLKTIQVYQGTGQINFVSENGVLYNSDKSILVCNPSSGKIVVPDYVTSICNYAFPNVDVSVTIPPSVKVFGDNIFVNEIDEWTPSDEEPLHVYGYTGSAIDLYCKKTNWGVKFLPFDFEDSTTNETDGGVNN